MNIKKKLPKSDFVGISKAETTVHNVSNEFSIVADPFAYANFHSMRFIEYMGAKWKISNVEVQYPRLILTVGGVYNEQTTETA